MEIKGVNNQMTTYPIEMARKVSRNDMPIEPIKVEGEAKRYTEEELIESIESANKHFIAFDRRFEFSIHEKTKQIMVKIVDVNTEEIIREIPPEKILDLVAAIWEIAGIIVDERV